MTDEEAAAIRALSNTYTAIYRQAESIVNAGNSGDSGASRLPQADAQQALQLMFNLANAIPALLSERAALRTSLVELLDGLKAFFDERGITWESASMRHARALLADDKGDAHDDSDR